MLLESSTMLSLVKVAFSEHKASVASALAGMFTFTGMEGETDKDGDTGDKARSEGICKREGGRRERGKDGERHLATMCKGVPRICEFSL